MRFRLSILTLFRSPMKTLVTFILLFATSFAFVSRGAEYATTVAEIDKAEAQYTAVGTLQRSTEGYYEYMEETIGPEVYGYENGAYIDRLSNATAPIEQEVIDLVLGSEYLANSEFVMVSGGTTPDNLEVVLEQPLYALLDYREWGSMPQGSFGYADAFAETVFLRGEEYAGASLGNNSTNYVAGHSDNYHGRQRFHLHYYESTPMEEIENDHIKHAEYFYAFMPYYSDWNPNVMINPYIDYPYINMTELRENFGIVDPLVALADPELYGLVRQTNDDGLPTIPTLEYMNTVIRNCHTNELVHVSSMDSLHKFHNGEMYISEGRAITNSDTEYVCVVGANYAEKNGLEIGDRIDYTMSADTLVHSGKVFGREPPYPQTKYSKELKKDVFVNIAGEQSLTERGLDTVTRTYEIVGIWSDSNYDVADPFSYSPNTVFVPASTYPWAGEVEPTMLPSTFSFTLNHPGDMAKMQAELGDQLAALGYELSINDMGYAEAKPSFEFMKLSALIGFIAMSAALLLSLILTTYLYIIRKKHDYAIMRALGTTRARSNRSLLVGLFALAIPAVFLGSLLALALTQGFAADLSAQISEITGSATASSMPAWLVGAFGTGVLGLLLVFARAGLTRVGRTPPLALLQGR